MTEVPAPKQLQQVPCLHIHLLGQFSLSLDGTPVTAFDWPRLHALLAYLLLHRTAPQSRASLAYALWPDSTDSQAHTNLRQLVHRLRHTLPYAGSFLRIEKQTLHWQPDASWTLDVADFERALAQAEQARDRKAALLALEQAVEYYRGDLLPGCYDEWILPERERLRLLFLGALERLVLLLEEEGKYKESIGAAQHLLRADPLHEAAYRHLMRLYAARGDRAAALRTYHACATVLERELSTSPSPATRTAYERLLQGEALPGATLASPTTRVAATPLVGRQDAWERLQEVWRRTSSEGPHLVVLSGEAGIGKTRLAEELLVWAARQGIAMASARCYAAEGELSYAPITAWLRADAIKPALTSLAEPWLVEVARCVPEVLEKRPDLPQPAPLVESWQRQHLFEALARALLGGPPPSLLLLDDLQWCDQDTLAWLHYLLRFDPQARVLVVGTLRPEEVVREHGEHPVEPLLLALRRSQQVTEMPLGPLSAEDTVLLAAHVAGQAPGRDQGDDLYRETEGNPLFVVEAVRMGFLDTATRQEVAADRSASPLPPTVQAVLSARLGQLGAQARELVSVAAVIGRAFTFQVLARVSGGGEEMLMQALDELWRRRIVREQEADTYDFSHDKIREVAYAALSNTRKRLLHLHVAEALEALYANQLETVSGQIAAHYEAAGVSDRAVTYYQKAGETAQQIYANAEALAFFRKVLALLETSPRSEAKPGQRWGIIAHCHERIGDVLRQTGQLAEAKASYQRALAHIPEHELIWQARLYRQIGWNEMEQNEQALQHYDRAEAVLGAEPPDSALAWWHEWIQIQLSRLILYYNWAKLPELAEQIEKVRPAVERNGTPTQRATFFMGLTRLGWRRDRYMPSEETLQYSQAALAASQESGDLNELAFATFGLGFSHLWSNHLDEAEKHLQAALTLAERTGDLVLQARCLTYLTIEYRKQGGVEQVRSYATKALAVARALQFDEYIRYARGNMAWIAWREGNMAEVREHGQAALESLVEDEPFLWVALWPLVDLALREQQLSNAIIYARLLLEPLQLRLPDALARLLEQALRAWDSNQSEAAHIHLNAAIALANQTGYL